MSTISNILKSAEYQNLDLFKGKKNNVGLETIIGKDFTAQKRFIRITLWFEIYFIHTYIRNKNYFEKDRPRQLLLLFIVFNGMHCRDNI